MLIQRACVYIAVAAAFGLGIGLPLAGVSLQFHPSSHPSKDYASEQPPQGENRPIAGYIIKEPEAFLDRMLGDPVAVATFVLAALTFATVLIIGRQTSLARANFNAAYPPELVMREVGFTTLKSGEDCIVFTLVNRGRNPCEIVESEFVFQSTPPDGQAVQTEGANRIGPIRLTAGEFHTYSRPMASEEEDFLAGARGMTDCYFRSTIIYADAAGLRRRFMLTRKCEPSSNRFIPTGSPEDEYTD
jgi:hypothetical protein